jgi:hypothetical protein
MISLKENTILALSNLLSANVESGLKYSLSMGYHEDTQIRTAFMQVLSNILNQGTEFEGLGENTIKSRYSQLVEVRRKIYEFSCRSIHKMMIAAIGTTSGNRTCIMRCSYCSRSGRSSWCPVFHL